MLHVTCVMPFGLHRHIFLGILTRVQVSKWVAFYSRMMSNTPWTLHDKMAEQQIKVFNQKCNISNCLTNMQTWMKHISTWKISQGRQSGSMALRAICYSTCPRHCFVSHSPMNSLLIYHEIRANRVFFKLAYYQLTPVKPMYSTFLHSFPSIGLFIHDTKNSVNYVGVTFQAHIFAIFTPRKPYRPKRRDRSRCVNMVA